jgi:hypothetical protein
MRCGSARQSTRRSTDRIARTVETSDRRLSPGGFCSPNKRRHSRARADLRPGPAGIVTSRTRSPTRSRPDALLRVDRLSVGSYSRGQRAGGVGSLGLVRAPNEGLAEVVEPSDRGPLVVV